MPLREPDLLGFSDPRNVGEQPATEPEPKPRAKNAAAKPAGTQRKPKATTGPAPSATSEAQGVGEEGRRASGRSSARPRTAVALGDEERVFTQVMTPRDLRRRLETAVFELDERAPRLAEQQIILAALIWRHVRYQDAAALRRLGALLDEFAADEVSLRYSDGKIGGQLPRSLKRQIDGAALRLKDTHARPYRKDIVNALIWRHVNAEDPQRLDELEALLRDYEAVAFPERAQPAAA